MKLFDYLKWREEWKAKQKAKKEDDQLEKNLIDCIGEVEGLKVQIEIHERHSKGLMFSNHVTIAGLSVRLAKAVAKREYLYLKRKVARNLKSKPPEELQTADYKGIDIKYGNRLTGSFSSNERGLFTLEMQKNKHHIYLEVPMGIDNLVDTIRSFVKIFERT